MLEIDKGVKGDRGWVVRYGGELQKNDKREKSVTWKLPWKFALAQRKGRGGSPVKGWNHGEIWPALKGLPKQGIPQNQ